MNTPFGDILRTAIEEIPGAVGGSFAASDGETVDWFAQLDRDEWALFTAHYGVVLAHIQSALNLFHFGEAELVICSHRDLDILIHSVLEGYYAMIVLSRAEGHLAHAMTALTRASVALREEMM